MVPKEGNVWDETYIWLNDLVKKDYRLFDIKKTHLTFLKDFFGMRCAVAVTVNERELFFPSITGCK